MDVRWTLLCLTSGALVVSGTVYGSLFLRRGNILLGIEFLIFAISSSNTFIYLLSGLTFAYKTTVFLDAFTRAFGIPVLASAGLLQLTRGWRFTIRDDILILLGGLLATAFLTSIESIAAMLPYCYALGWTVFSVVALGLAMRLWKLRKKKQAVALSIAVIFCQIIAMIDGTYINEGGSPEVFYDFLILALISWSFLPAQLFRAYRAMERLNAGVAYSMFRSSAESVTEYES